MAKISKQRKKELDILARSRAEEIRRAWGLGIEPIADIFDLIERRLNVVVLRYPDSNPDLSAFIAKKGEDFLIYINTNMSLGHQIFSGAHEMSHLLYDKNDLQLLICKPGEESGDEKEILADFFAGYFLLPEEGVRQVFLSRFGTRYRVDLGTVMALQGTFRVSYSAMLYALLKYGFISPRVYGHLKKYGTPEKAPVLQHLARKYGVYNLVVPTEAEIPKALILALNSNYNEGRISFNKLRKILSLWNKKPEEMGFTYEDPV